MPPRKPRQAPKRDDDFEEKSRMMKLSQQEEDKEHQKDKEKIVELMSKYSVDLVVVGANKLEARKLKQTLADIANTLKTYNPQQDMQDDDD